MESLAPMPKGFPGLNLDPGEPRKAHFGDTEAKEHLASLTKLTMKLRELYFLTFLTWVKVFISNIGHSYG
jgi:hypothetical protein